MHNLGISRYQMSIDGVRGVVAVSNRYLQTEVKQNQIRLVDRAPGIDSRT